jgi:hypothetical protein
MKPVYIEINSNGSKLYYKDKAMTILHREDGPAYEGADGHKEWWLNAARFREQEFILKTAKEIVLTMDEIASKFGIEVSKLKIQK